MSIAELKEKIVEEVNHLDDEKKLQHVLHILNNGNDKVDTQSISAMKYKDQLFNKHNGLLEKLS